MQPNTRATAEIDINATKMPRRNCAGEWRERGCFVKNKKLKQTKHFIIQF